MPSLTDKVRYFIVSPGRTGSTLLSVVLAEAGADFGMPAPREWDPATGDMEHPGLTAATRHFARAFRISPEKPASLAGRWRWDRERHRAKRHLRRALAEATFLKAHNLDLAVQPAFQAGYLPRVVLNARRFGPHAVSRFQRSGHSSVDEIGAHYCRIYRNGLLLLSLYGGCVVDYDELLDAGEASWAAALAEVTGLDRGAILAARGRRVSPGPPARPDPVGPVIDPTAEAIYGELRKLRGRALAPSPQALRGWARRKGV